MTLRQRNTEVMGDRAVLGGVLVTKVHCSFLTPWKRMFRDSISSRTWLSDISLPRFYTRSSTQRCSGIVKVWKLTPSNYPRMQCADRGSEPLRLLLARPANLALYLGRQTARTKIPQRARKVRASLILLIKMGVLLGSSPAGKQVLFAWEFVVVPSGLSLRGPNMLLEMRLLSDSDKTTCTDGSEPIAVGMRNPLGWKGRTDLAKTAEYTTPPSGSLSCRLPIAAGSPVPAEVTDRGMDPAQCAGRPLCWLRRVTRARQLVLFGLARDLSGSSLGFRPNL